MKKKKRKHCRMKQHQKKKIQMKRSTDTVVNISNVPLSEDERDLLSRGLSFCPKPSNIDCFQLEVDICQFFSRLRLKEFYCDVGEEHYNPKFKN